MNQILAGEMGVSYLKQGDKAEALISDTCLISLDQKPTGQHRHGLLICPHVRPLCFTR